MMPTDDFEATFLHDAIKCSNNIIFNDDDAIIQLLCTKTSDEIKILNKTYKKRNKISLVLKICTNFKIFKYVKKFSSIWHRLG
jgi:hypothetical protein